MDFLMEITLLGGGTLYIGVLDSDSQVHGIDVGVNIRHNYFIFGYIFH